MIDVSNIKPAAVLAALYNASTPLGMGFLQFTPEPMTEDEAEKLIAANTYKNRAYFDYLRGRVMKVEINGKTLDPRLYDRDNGHGAAEAALMDLLTAPANARTMGA
jgi:hypothetical protein